MISPPQKNGQKCTDPLLELAIMGLYGFLYCLKTPRALIWQLL